MGERWKERVRRLGERLEVRWDEAHVEEALLELEGRLASRARRRVATASVVSIVLLGALVWAGWGRHTLSNAPAVSVVTAASSEERPHPSDGVVLAFPDGSRATALEPSTALTVREVSSSRIAVDLAKGPARFDVVPGLARAFVVRVGSVTVSVVGTIFDVSPMGEGARVVVHRGVVAVRWPDGERRLAAGEEGVFPPPRPGRARRAEGPAPPIAPAHAEQRPTWRELARAGHYQDAYTSLRRAEPEEAIRDEVQDLLLAADVARLSGHPDEAIAPLRAVITRFGEDARASLAAFTLGRILLTELHRPAEAAQAFARCRELAPGETLAEDALAREVEAWARAGERERAARRAAEYIERYPEGWRAAEVRRWGRGRVAP